VQPKKSCLLRYFYGLPIVLCHRDFWIENIFLSQGKLRLIDWDCVGWGFAGEDIASLIADDKDVEYMKSRWLWS